MIRYYRASLPDDDRLNATVDHVRQHLSSIASESDDPEEFRDRVEITFENQDDGSIHVNGELDEPPRFDYTLPPEYLAPNAAKYQRKFGERVLDPAEYEEHMKQKAAKR